MVTTYDDSAYDVLVLSPKAGAAEIRASYLRLARLTHPDVGGSDALFRRVETAYATLSVTRHAVAGGRLGQKDMVAIFGWDDNLC
jgi:curved DNA-binding protein CbpA